MWRLFMASLRPNALCLIGIGSVGGKPAGSETYKRRSWASAGSMTALLCPHARATPSRHPRTARARHRAPSRSRAAHEHASRSQQPLGTALEGEERI